MLCVGVSCSWAEGNRWPILSRYQEMPPGPFAALPYDALSLIFEQMFPRDAPPEPLAVAARRWLSLRLTCQACAAALEAQPPQISVRVSVPPPGSLPWLQRHVAVLHLVPPNSTGEDWSVADVFDYTELMYRLGSGLAAPGAVVGPGAFTDIVQAGPLLALHACTNLRELRLSVGAGSEDDCPPGFDTAPLGGLPFLRHLDLEGFSQADLAGLPASLRTLRFTAGQLACFGSSPFPPSTAFAMPPGCRLDTACILYNKQTYTFDDDDEEEEGFHDSWRLRQRLPLMWRACRRLEVDGEVLAMGEIPAGQPMHQSDDLGPVLEPLLAAMSGAAPLRQMELDPEALFAFPSGALTPVAALATAAGQAQLTGHAAGELLVAEIRDSLHALLPQSPLDRARHVPPRPAPRLVVTSAVPPPAP